VDLFSAPLLYADPVPLCGSSAHSVKVAHSPKFSVGSFPHESTAPCRSFQGARAISAEHL